MEHNPAAPEPADGRQATRDAIERLRALGANLGRPHAIDFHVAAPHEESALAIAREAQSHGFVTRLVHEDEGDWTVWCTKTLVPTEAAISAWEAALHRLSSLHGGFGDGWGAEPVP
jgi:regulator of RNase E activity RraB